MANIESTAQNQNSKVTQKRKSTRIDMTAMVDVAFLLLTFFVLTAVLDKHSIIEFQMPLDVDVQAQVAEEKVMTFILDDNNVIKYYHGITDPQVLETGYNGLSGVRKVIFDHLDRYSFPCQGKHELGKRIPEGCWDPVFVIKPRHSSSYGNLVDLIDEMMITNAKKYVLGEFTEADSLLLESAARKLQASGNP
ncbi:biopolymer transporter ExbD [bacterium]|nr:biopolymer transporter ExbD [bacterium]